MRKKRILIALGGNAIISSNEKGDVKDQLRNIQKSCIYLAKLVQMGYQLIITHGNGPQVGNLLIQQECEKNVSPQTLDVLGAMTQGQIGYMLQQKLMNVLKKEGVKIPIATVLTQILVQPDDPAFKNPSKPIGPFYTLKQAEKLKSKKQYVIIKVKPNKGKVYRRVVASPIPKSIVEKEAIKKLMKLNFLVIASGGGGIPVIKGENDELKGVEAVIDKDLSAEALAEIVKPDIFLILTDVEKVKLNYDKPDERNLDSMSIEEAERFTTEGHFLPGSMKPKVEACIRFLKTGGRTAIITSLDKAVEAIKGKTGTVIYR
jgi:carbamate kinase